MPEWGFSKDIRDSEPYGLAEWCLEPGKVITDPIHGDVFITKLEQMLLDTPPMQRLRRVDQLGTTHLVYPGATHTRFSHSLGAVRVVQTLLDSAIDQQNRPQPSADLFAEWEAEGDGEFDKRLAAATVLARLGALLHDIGHLPFGHTIEDDLKLLQPHDENASRFVQLWKQVLASCKTQIHDELLRGELDRDEARRKHDSLLPLRRGQPLHDDLRRLILSKEKSATDETISAVDKVRYPFTVDMVGNTICADLLDYLERDHTFAGLPISLGRRYLSSFYVTPEAKAGIYKQRMALLIRRKGKRRQDIITEILKHLRYRYELQERVLVHHTKLAADAMVGKMLEVWLTGERERLENDPAKLEHSAAPVPGEFRYPGAEGKGPRIERVSRWSLEQLLLTHGDEGVLERLVDASGTGGFETAAKLARMLLDRNLFKPAANAMRPAAAAGLYEKFGSLPERRRLEEAACEHAGIKEDWHLVLWVPDPDMRLKLAELLVDDGNGIAQFKDVVPHGSEIYEAHKELWTVSVFTHPTVTIGQRRAALAKLATMLGISWDTYGADLGPDPDLAPEYLAAVEVIEDAPDTVSVREIVPSSGELAQQAARGGMPRTQQELKNAARVRLGQVRPGREGA
jgi:HD superfamily phosphohydrolase